MNGIVFGRILIFSEAVKFRAKLFISSESRSPQNYIPSLITMPPRERGEPKATLPTDINYIDRLSIHLSKNRLINESLVGGLVEKFRDLWVELCVV